MTTTTPSSTVTLDRRPLLRAHLERLYQMTAAQPRIETTCSFSAGNETIRVTPAEWGAMHSAFVGVWRGQNWTGLVAESIALHARFLEDIARFREATGSANAEASEQAREQVMRDAALAVAFVRDFQEAAEGLARQGQFDRADQIRQYQERARSIAQRSAELLGEDLYAEAAAWAEGAPRSLEPLVAAELQNQAEPAETAASATLSQRRLDPKKKDRLILAVCGAVTALTVVVVLGVLPALNQRHVPELKLSDFAGIPAIKDVTARPPVLFVKVDAQIWDGMSRDARAELLEKTTKLMLPIGYGSVNFNATTGRPLARWSSTQGVHYY